MMESWKPSTFNFLSLAVVCQNRDSQLQGTGNYFKKCIWELFPQEQRARRDAEMEQLRTELEQETKKLEEMQLGIRKYTSSTQQVWV